MPHARSTDTRRRRLILVTAVSVSLSLSLPSALPAQSFLDNLARPMEGRSMRSSSTSRQGADGSSDPRAKPIGDASERSNFDNRSLRPGETQVVLDAAGPGLITHMWFTFVGPEPQRPGDPGGANHQELLLRMYWDGNPKPAVETPFGDFFAAAFGKRAEVNSIPVVVEGGDSYNCYWPMPFRKSARVEITNQSAKPLRLLYHNIDWIRKPTLPADTPYFHARYRQEYPAEGGKDYLILDTLGKGHYVGTVLAIRTRSPLWYGEGDEKISIDGEETPSIWGTGTEDFFCCAMGLASCGTPHFGVPIFDEFEIVGSRTAAYRWHVADPVVFEKGIRVVLEHRSWISEDENPEGRRMSWNEREDDYSSVAFWYQTGESTFDSPVPGAEARRLPSLERTIALARDFVDAKHHGEGPVDVQEIGEHFEHPILFYHPELPRDAWVEVPIEVRRKEPLRLLLNAATSYDYGRYQPYLDGVELGGPIDFHSDRLASREFHLLDFWPEPGTHTLRLECVGKSARSEGHYLGLESVRLRERRPRVEAIARDRDKDWRKEPILYTKR